MRADGTRRLYSVDPAPCRTPTPGWTASARHGSSRSTRSKPSSRAADENGGRSDRRRGADQRRSAARSATACWRPARRASVKVSRSYRDPVEDVWDACTNAERVPRWSAGRAASCSSAGASRSRTTPAATIEGCEPPRSFSATWESAAQVSWITRDARPRPTTAGPASRSSTSRSSTTSARGVWEQFGPGAVGDRLGRAVLDLTRHLDAARNPTRRLGDVRGRPRFVGARRAPRGPTPRRPRGQGRRVGEGRRRRDDGVLHGRSA